MTKYAHLYLTVDHEDRPEVSAEHLRREPIDGDVTVNIHLGRLLLEMSGPRDVIEDFSTDLARALVMDRASFAAERSGGVRPPVDPAVSGGAGSDHGAGAPAPLKVVPG